MARHRHRYVTVSDGPGYMSSHDVCRDCGHDPWQARYRAALERQAEVRAGCRSRHAWDPLGVICTRCGHIRARG